MHFSYNVITYQDLIKGFDKDLQDKYAVVSYQKENRSKIFLANPFLKTKKNTFMYLVKEGNVVIGRCYYFPTQMKANNETLTVQSASALYVQEQYRNYAVGADIIAYSTFSEEYNQRIFAGISPMALPIYKKLKYCVFPLQRYMLRKNYYSYVKQKGIKGWIGQIFAKIISDINGLPKIIYGHKKSLSKRYMIKRLDVVPNWIDDIVKNDGHKYMELHDHKWMQWQLSGAFRKGERNFQRFFGIYEQSNPVGFFMIKERMIDASAGMIIGSIVEWGSKDVKTLKESDIYELALPTFSRDAYIIDIATNNEDTIKRIQKLGFVHSGEEHILFKDNTKEFRDASDASLWRLRYGYADTIFS